jgi:hypothetical protein
MTASYAKFRQLQQSAECHKGYLTKSGIFNLQKLTGLVAHFTRSASQTLTFSDAASCLIADY